MVLNTKSVGFAGILFAILTTLQNPDTVTAIINGLLHPSVTGVASAISYFAAAALLYFGKPFSVDEPSAPAPSAAEPAQKAQ